MRRVASAINITFHFFKKCTYRDSSEAKTAKWYHLLSLCGGHISVILTSAYLNYFTVSKTFFFLIKRSMQQQIWNLTTEFLPCCASFKVIKVLFPSISRAHGNQERVHQGLPSSLSLRLSKTPEEAALGYLGDGEHNVSGCYQGVGISHQPVADHLGKHHADWLAQHHSFCFDTTHTCMQ